MGRQAGRCVMCGSFVPMCNPNIQQTNAAGVVGATRGRFEKKGPHPHPPTPTPTPPRAARLFCFPFQRPRIRLPQDILPGAIISTHTIDITVEGRGGGRGAQKEKKRRNQRPNATSGMSAREGALHYVLALLCFALRRVELRCVALHFLDATIYLP